MVKESDWLQDALLDPVNQVKVERRATSWLVLANMRLGIRKAASRGPASPDDLPSDSSFLAFSKLTYWTKPLYSTAVGQLERHTGTHASRYDGESPCTMELALRPTGRAQESLFDLSCVRVHRTIGSQACNFVR